MIDNNTLKLIYSKAQDVCFSITLNDFNNLSLAVREELLLLALYCDCTTAPWYPQSTQQVATKSYSSNCIETTHFVLEPVRCHNCWECETSDCFNKKFTPKESNEGYTCERWT